MRTSFVFTIVALFLFGVAVADIDVCQTSTYELKVEMRALNAWRAACEDNNWKGAACYNYWAQLNEVMTLENNLQTCLTGIFQERKALMLGDATKRGIYTQDAANSRSVNDANSEATQNLDVAEGTANRAHVTTKANAAINAIVSLLDEESVDTRSTVASEYSTTKTHESDAHDDIRALENTSAKRILDTIKAQEGQTRAFVDSAHIVTKSLINDTDVLDEIKSRDENNKQEKSTRATMVIESTETQRSSNDEARDTQAFDTTSEKTTRTNTTTEQQTSRASVSAEHTTTKAEVADLLAGVNAEIADQTPPTQNKVRTDADATKAAATAASQESRELLAGLQAALVGSYGAEAAQLADMWGTLMKFLVHFDLQGKCEKWSETFTYATMTSVGISRFAQLRAETLATLNYNENYYGSSYVGWARWYWNQGEIYYNANNLRAAADQYRLSYNSATQAR